MKILHRYILKETARNLCLCMLAMTLLFLIFDFFDRIDNILRAKPSLGMVFQYFLMKIPPLLTLTLPIAMLVAVLFTVGLLSKSSEFTAMRASGYTVFWLARPIFLLALVLSLTSILLNETLVPYCMRRVREIYNIDIRAKDQSGEYSQQDLWWRSGDQFFSADNFDSRTNVLNNLIRIDVNSSFEITKRTDALSTAWVNSLFGWSMESLEQLQFEGSKITNRRNLPSLTLPIEESPKDFYDAELDPQTMSFSQLRHHIKKQIKNGLPARELFSDLYAKISFPLVTLMISLVALPFALKPARTGSLALSFMAGLGIAFSYYVIHSLSLAMGRAEIWQPFMAAWMANILMAVIALVLYLGVETPE